MGYADFEGTMIGTVRLEPKSDTEVLSCVLLGPVGMSCKDTLTPIPPELQGRTETDTPPRLEESQLLGSTVRLKSVPPHDMHSAKPTLIHGVLLYKLLERTEESEPTVQLAETFPGPWPAPGSRL